MSEMIVGVWIWLGAAGLIGLGFGAGWFFRGLQWPERMEDYRDGNGSATVIPGGWPPVLEERK